MCVRYQNQEGQNVGRAIPPKTHLIKTAGSTVRRNRSALVSIDGTAAGSKTITAPDRPTDVVLNNEAPSVPQTPCKVSTPVPDDFSAGSSTPRGSTMATPAQEIHPVTYFVVAVNNKQTVSLTLLYCKLNQKEYTCNMQIS